MDQIEDRLRTAAASGTGKEAVSHFNNLVRQDLQMRHQIQVNPKSKTKEVHPTALDGGDSRRWRADVLLMYNGPHESRKDLQRRLLSYATPGSKAYRAWPSIYFKALHEGLHQSCSL